MRNACWADALDRGQDDQQSTAGKTEFRSTETVRLFLYLQMCGIYSPQTQLLEQTEDCPIIPTCEPTRSSWFFRRSYATDVSGRTFWARPSGGNSPLVSAWIRHVDPFSLFSLFFFSSGAWMSHWEGSLPSLPPPHGMVLVGQRIIWSDLKQAMPVRLSRAPRISLKGLRLARWGANSEHGKLRAAVRVVFWTLRKGFLFPLCISIPR